MRAKVDRVVISAPVEILNDVQEAEGDLTAAGWVQVFVYLESDDVNYQVELAETVS